MGASTLGSVLLMLIAAEPPEQQPLGQVVVGGAKVDDRLIGAAGSELPVGTAIPLMRDFGPSSLPIHAARNPAVYLVEELLMNRLHVFSSGLARPAFDPLFRPLPPPPPAHAAGLENDATRTSLALFQARLQLADLKAQAADDNPDVAALSERVGLLEKRLAELRAAGERIDAGLLRQQRRQIRTEVQDALEQAERQDTSANPQVEHLRQRESALKPLLK